jgi:hypothetical protein
MVLRKPMTKGFAGVFNQNEEDINFMASILVSMESRVLDCEGGIYLCSAVYLRLAPISTG